MTLTLKTIVWFKLKFLHHLKKGSHHLFQLLNRQPLNTTARFIVCVCVQLKVASEYDKTVHNNPREQKSIIDGLIEHFEAMEGDPFHFVMVSPERKEIYTTNDAGITFHVVRQMPFRPDKLIMNPAVHTLLASLDESTHTLYVSTNYGETWRQTQTGVKTFYWSLQSGELRELRAFCTCWLE